jgi:hypothetical protein
MEMTEDKVIKEKLVIKETKERKEKKENRVLEPKENQVLTVLMVKREIKESLANKARREAKATKVKPETKETQAVVELRVSMDQPDLQGIQAMLAIREIRARRAQVDLLENKEIQVIMDLLETRGPLETLVKTATSSSSEIPREAQDQNLSFGSILSVR